MKIELDIPNELIRFLNIENNNTELNVKELIMYSLVVSKQITWGQAAKMLNITKLKLTSDLGHLGIPYYDMSAEELEEEIRTLELFADNNNK